jgi:23S rRNA pseudouridine1911/1915/1917 synthase
VGEGLTGIGGVARPGIVHRIDKETSGLLVVAKTDAAYAGLQRQFAEHSIERVYTAVVHGLPSPFEGVIEANIGRSSHNRQKMTVVDEDHGKTAVTHYRTMRPLPPFASVLECRLETGRTHQIRVHMAEIGHPLIGDPLYTARLTGKAQVQKLLSNLGFARQALHAGVLGFEHPMTGEELRFQSALPADLARLIAALSEISGSAPTR